MSEVQLLTRENRFANFIGKSFLIYAKIAASVTLALRDLRSARRDSRSTRRDSRSARNETRLVTFLWVVLYLKKMVGKEVTDERLADRQ